MKSLSELLFKNRDSMSLKASEVNLWGLKADKRYRLTYSTKRGDRTKAIDFETACGVDLADTCAACGAPFNNQDKPLLQNCESCGTERALPRLTEILVDDKQVDLPSIRKETAKLPDFSKLRNISTGNSHRVARLTGNKIKVGSHSEIPIIGGKDVILGEYVHTNIVYAEHDLFTGDGTQGTYDSVKSKLMVGSNIKIGDHGVITTLVFRPSFWYEKLRLGNYTKVDNLIIVGREGYYPECKDGVSIGRISYQNKGEAGDIDGLMAKAFVG